MFMPSRESWSFGTTIEAPMFKFRTISARLVLAISLIIAATCAVLGGFSIVQQHALTRLALDQHLRLQ